MELNKKIILISDESYQGGAMITNRTMINEGIAQGHDVEIYTYGQTERENNIVFNPGKADFYILANYGWIKKQELSKFCKEFKNKYIRYTHDIPGFLQMIPSSFFQDSINNLQMICDNAAHIFLISPMQFQVIARQIKLDESKVTINPPFIDLSVFKNTDAVREKNSWLILGDISRARGIEKSLGIIQQYGGESVSIVGPEVDAGYVDFLQQTYGNKFTLSISGAKPYSEIPQLMSTFENFIYTPEIYDSFCRKIIEAQMSGCNIYADTLRIGMFSYPDKYNFIQGCAAADKILWKIIGDKLTV